MALKSAEFWRSYRQNRWLVFMAQGDSRQRVLCTHCLTAFARSSD